MPESKPMTATARMGVYQRLDEVPDRYRLYHHADAYENRDIFQEFLDEEVMSRLNSEWTIQAAKRQGRRWKEFMANRERHHALATPQDLEDYARDLLDTNALKTAFRYWKRVESFYRWLMWRTDYPHLYNPALMAAAEQNHARKIWRFKYA